MSRKIIVTGATGLIGKEVLPYLTDKGYDVYAITTEGTDDNSVNWIKCDLFDYEQMQSVFEQVKPEYLINFAWITGGDYLTNPVNIKFRDTGIQMLKCFTKNGGKRAVYAGTCFEYDIKNSPLKESDKINPKTLYAKCKNELREECEKYSKEKGVSFAWGRIFYVYGRNEKPSRLTPAIINKLKTNEEFLISAPNNYLDYMYTKDIARAFLTILDSEYEGSVNICTGKGIFLKDYALKIQTLLHKENLIKYDENKPSELTIVGDNTILKSLGFKQNYDTESALCEIIQSY